MTNYRIDTSKTVPFKNNASYCIGTGRMGLALRYEYHKQLAQVQKDIGFKYIRGHGLFHDDMAVYHTYEENGTEKEEYNFSYIDLVFDDYLSLGLKPFVEFGFMPGQLASGDQTVFYWKGNTTPPKDYDKWERLIKSVVMHWISRYGIDEVLTWLFEVWNEPNLAGFWKDADMDEYFKLYQVTAGAVKDCDKRLRIGGPSICGVDDERWMRCFLEFCSENDIPLDFITRHAYGTEPPEFEGRYVYQKLRTPCEFMDEPRGSREIIDSFPKYKGMEIHLTEYNTSYNPRNPIHDTNQNAAYIAELLSVLGDVCESYSYWTFGDVFEETGVAFTPFSGCFGLLTNGGIPKPTYWAFVFYKDLFDTAVEKTDKFIVTKSDTGDIRAVAWNLISDDDDKTQCDIHLRFSVTVADGTYCLIQKTVDEQVCNPMKTWLDMGSPAYPSKEQFQLLKECSQPQVRTQRFDVCDGIAVLDISLSSNAVCYFELTKITPETDRGFNTKRISGL